VSANPEAYGSELDYKTGDVVEADLLLQGVCDGTAPCSIALISGSVVPWLSWDDLLTEPTGSGYTKSWPSGGCGNTPTVISRLTIEINGAEVSGTYEDPGGGCFTDTQATFTGTIERVVPAASTTGG